jgi:glycosyltransferase involved in cell wall biosynthesis
MKVALVHDYLKEYGGAERVLAALAEIWPKAPIYTAFYVKDSAAGRALANSKVVESKFAPLIKHGNLYSPLRFLAPTIWKSFDFSDYDLVVASSSWYITRGFKVGPKTKVICYCHTPPRYLYGYQTSIEWQRYGLVRAYAGVVNHFLRIFDFESAQKVNWFIANSKNVGARIEKFYRRDSTVIYPPVNVGGIIKATAGLEPKDYFLVVSRVVGGKGIELAIEVAQKLKVPLKVIGEEAGLKWMGKNLENLKNKYVEFLGRLPDEEVYKYYGQCKAFLALATDEDFGITPVEAMAAGRPVIAYCGGGYLETVIEGKTGEFFPPTVAKDDSYGGRGAQPTVESLSQVLKDFDPRKYNRNNCVAQARKFNKERFKKEIVNFVKEKVGSVA